MRRLWVVVATTALAGARLGTAWGADPPAPQWMEKLRQRDQEGEGVKVVPLFNVSLMGGQYFFQDEKSHMNGNASVNLTPAVKVSDRWTVLPGYHGVYQGTKQVTDAVGSGTLFQQMTEHRLAVTGLRASEDGRWRFKPNASYKKQFLKETRDETWGKGLFDYDKTGVGFEVEEVYEEPFSLRAGYDFFYVTFPHFQSLESKSGVDPSGNPLGRETAGTDVLDTYNHQFNLIWTGPFPRPEPVVALQAQYSLLYQHYKDQPIINQSGQPTAPNRKDFTNSLNFGVSYPRALGDGYRLLTRLSFGYARDESDQNTFDASRTFFVPRSYSWWNSSFGPGVTLAWGDVKQPTWVSLSCGYTYTQWVGRLAQDASGQYTNEKQWQDRSVASLAYGYPIAPNFSLKAQANFLWARSNMAFERTYRYAYRTANYLLGFTYDY